ncbi:MAG: hypothetical protein AAF585_16175, partial [Verrucomicrobiota bacterium]
MATQGSLITTIQTDSSNPNSSIGPANTLTVTESGLNADGVGFDLVLTVVGSGDLNLATTGTGVVGGSSNLLNDGEFLTYSLAVQNEVGGTVVFDGFTALDFNSFANTPDSAVLSLDNSLATAGDNFATITTDPGTIPGLPTTFTLISVDDMGTSSFRVDDISAQFTGTVA